MMQRLRQRTPQRGTATPPSASTPTLPCSGWLRSPSRCTAGRGTTSADSSAPSDGPGGGLAVTGNYPGKARTADELRADLAKALSLIPGRHRLNLHAIYGDTNGQVERDELTVEHFRSWIDWARSLDIGIDFNPTFFAHPKASDGFTLAHPDPCIRRFWIDHGVVCRRIGAAIGQALGSPCVTNVWIPDGFKDLPIDRRSPRERLADSLDAIFAEPLDPRHNIDTVESKLFGIGSECYVVGSHEFYFGYAVRHNKWLCLDTGHFHPTEFVSEKLSAVLLWVPGLLLHVSRGVRWDSDHVVILDNELLALATELVRGDYLGRTRIGLDYFDASINRVAAWVIGTRAMLKALMIALVEPTAQLRNWKTPGIIRHDWRCSKKSSRCRPVLSGTTTVPSKVPPMAWRGSMRFDATNAMYLLNANGACRIRRRHQRWARSQIKCDTQNSAFRPTMHS